LIALAWEQDTRLRPDSNSISGFKDKLHPDSGSRYIVAGPGYYGPRWTPDSQFISYLKFACGKQTVSIVPRDGNWEKVVVENGAFWNGEIAWSK
jgi:hypothetical protein